MLDIQSMKILLVSVLAATFLLGSNAFARKTKRPANGNVFAKKDVHTGEPRIGLQFRIADMNGDDNRHMVLPGESGTHILFNEG